MRVIGIDPGVENTGWGIVDFDGRDYRPVSYGVIKTFSSETIEKRITIIASDVESLVNKYAPDVCSMEDIFFYQNTSSAINVAKVIGALVLKFNDMGIATNMYTPLQIKTAVTGMGRAQKNQVQQMVKVILKLKEVPKPDHCADALADCICYCTHFVSEGRIHS